MATVANDSANKGVTWSVSGTGCSAAACGTVAPISSASGAQVTYAAPATVTSPATVTVSATSVADGTKAASTTITVSATPVPVSVTLSLTAASVIANGTQAFTATVQGDTGNKGVNWTLSGTGCGGATCGTLSAATSASGIATTYTAPGVVPTPGTVTLSATAVADTTKSAVATITIAAPAAAIVVTLSSTASVATSATQTFTATVTGDTANKGVSWSLLGAACSAGSCGSVAPASSASGAAVTYTAPATVPSPATISLRATSVADTSKSATATITITAASTGAVSVALTSKRGGLTVSQSLNFTANVTNDAGSQGVTWSVTGGGIFSTQGGTTATFVAPATAGVVTVTATSKADATKSASATIGVTDLAGVTTYHNDLSRDGVNTKEYALTTTNVTGSTFGKLFSCTADGAIYAQPLWLPNVTIGGGTHNVIVAATMRDSVYVFDADASPCVTYWHMQLIPTGETYGAFSDVGSSDIFPDIGILGTPVIDPSTKTIYLVTKTKAGNAYHQRLHALSLTTGAEATNSPVEISSSAITYPGNCDGGTALTFNAQTENQRPGLALVNNVVYVSWASHGDVDPYHGWVVGYKTADLSVAGILNTSPNAESGKAYCRGGIWMSGGAPAADADGSNLYFITGNGVYDSNGDLGNSYLKVTPSTMQVNDFFTPGNQDALDMSDSDVGSSGTALLIDQTAGPVSHLLVGGSKASIIYVLNRDDLGKINATDNVVQEFSVNGHSFSTPAFWNNALYYFGVQFGGTQVGQSFTFVPSKGTFTTTPASQTPTGFGFPGATPTISATPSGTNGIVWAIDSGAFGNNDNASVAGPAILHAYNAGNIAAELWNSSQASGSRDKAGNAVKFTVPTVANGKVYIGTRGNDNTQGSGTTFGEIDVYGLLPN
jgi:hypothetical protein